MGGLARKAAVCLRERVQIEIHEYSNSISFFAFISFIFEKQAKVEKEEEKKEDMPVWLCGMSFYFFYNDD